MYFPLSCQAFNNVSHHASRQKLLPCEGPQLRENNKMNKMLSLRLISPALLDTSVFSCKTVSKTGNVKQYCIVKDVLFDEKCVEIYLVKSGWGMKNYNLVS